MFNVLLKLNLITFFNVLNKKCFFVLWWIESHQLHHFRVNFVLRNWTTALINLYVYQGYFHYCFQLCIELNFDALAFSLTFKWKRFSMNSKNTAIFLLHKPVRCEQINRNSMSVAVIWSESEDTQRSKQFIRTNLFSSSTLRFLFTLMRGVCVHFWWKLSRTNGRGEWKWW